jgi:hypothetical protein
MYTPTHANPTASSYSVPFNIFYYLFLHIKSPKKIQYPRIIQLYVISILMHLHLLQYLVMSPSPFIKYFNRRNAVTWQTEQLYTQTDIHMDVCRVICTHETQLHIPLLQSLSLCIQNPFTHFLRLRTVCSGRTSDSNTTF